MNIIFCIFVSKKDPPVYAMKFSSDVLRVKKQKRKKLRKTLANLCIPYENMLKYKNKRKSEVEHYEYMARYRPFPYYVEEF